MKDNSFTQQIKEIPKQDERGRTAKICEAVLYYTGTIAEAAGFMPEEDMAFYTAAMFSLLACLKEEHPGAYEAGRNLYKRMSDEGK